MGSFRSGNRGGFGGRSGGNRPRDSRFGGGNRGGFGNRGPSRFNRRPSEMNNVTCDKCGKECQVPFKPSGDKPVYCSDCFRNNEGSRDNSRSRGSDHSSSSPGITSEQFNQLNAKLDNIIAILKDLEIINEDEDEDYEEDDAEEDEEEN